MFICGCHPQSNSVRHSIYNRNASYLWRTGRLVEQKRVAGKTKSCCGPRQLRTQTPEGSPAPKSWLPAWSLYPKTHKRFIRSCMGREGGRGWGSTATFMIEISHNHSLIFLLNGRKWELVIKTDDKSQFECNLDRYLHTSCLSVS